MAWSIRHEGVVQEGLTVYQVQEMIRSGQLGAKDEVTQDSTWIALGEHPTLARFLPEAAGQPPKPGDVIQLHGLDLRVGPDGKPLPPDPEAVAKLLRNEAALEPAVSETALRLKLVLTIVLGMVSAIGTLIFAWGVLRFFMER